MRARASKTPQKKRGWRDIEALKEQVRLKRLLADIWHEDIELDEDIFGERDRLAGYYTASRDEAIDIDDDEDDDFEEFEEKD